MKKDKIWIGVACVILGVFIAFQMKFIQKSYLNGSTPTLKTTEVLNEMAAVKAEKEALIEEVESLEKQLEGIQGSASEENAIVKNLTDELNKYKAFSGMTKVSGPGILVTIDNPPADSSFGLDINVSYDYKMLLDMLNELNSAGAEAISINEQRIINSTEVRFASPQMNVNTIPISPPFIIKSIGNSKTMEAAINQRFGIVNSLRDKGYYVEVKTVENIEVPAFNGTLKFKYANTVK